MNQCEKDAIYDEIAHVEPAGAQYQRGPVTNMNTQKPQKEYASLQLSQRHDNAK